uniref:Thioredoxin domain-containing protein n=1 Tax=Steinernema glaseri TaxID=37863 RepID=A0A1I8AV69_9BILA
MWTEHHRIDPEKYDKLKDSHRTLKQSVDTIRNSFVELTEFLTKELHFDDHTVEVIAVEFSHPEGFEKVVLTSWEDVAQQDPIASQPCESKIRRHIPVETEKGAFLQKIIDHSKELPRLVFIGKRSTKGAEDGVVRTFAFAKDGLKLPRLVFIGKRSTKGAEDGVVRTFAFAKDGLKVPMTLIGKTPPAEKEGLSIGVNPWDSEMRKIILDFEYYKYGTVFGVVLFPDGNEQCYLFKSTVFSHRGFVDMEATKNRRIDKVALSPEHNVGITIVPPFSKNTTGAKFGVFETM